ncbi:MAG: L,D-transpeptidase family protein [Shewanella sp.]|nr:L,D-transpeptidase family protein [Shewanella sp.]MCF1431506.1 L,D-transpeptidase family protein [Shewanella sp.]MCF1438672.1 L,D-transpeptidase family protein [Shewanella sp.]MCF1456326.1 L,D-transpeptidase family protein [Shewanella sp.]
MRLTGLLLTTLLLISPVLADDRRALDYFERHLRLLSLAGDDPKFAGYYQLYLSSSQNDKLAHFDDILMDISLYWQQQGVQLTSATGDRLQRVLAIEPRARDYLWVINRVRYLDWLQASSDWPQLSRDVWLRPGDQHPQVRILADRLKALGDLHESWQGGRHYDETLRQAVLRFQQRHGLEMDAVVGPRTQTWLNMAPERRAQLLARNFIDRFKYLSSLGDRYLLVNIPAYEMQLVDDGLLRLHSRVIVGSRYRQTPVMQSQISNLVINPSWRVPRKLTYRDIRPKILNDGSYISTKGFDAYDYQGNKLEHTAEEWQQLAMSRFPYRLVQRPGEDNALGRYKFHFANDFSVYLHDTPDKHLFSQADRALSSGCIRVERVDALANWIAANLVTDKQTWVELVNDPGLQTQWFALDDVLPIHLVYWTAWMQGPDNAQFRSDIYRKQPSGSTGLSAAAYTNTP